MGAYSVAYYRANEEKIKEQNKLYYQRNKQKVIDRAARDRPKRVRAVKRHLVEYLKCHPCVDCGERDIVVLQFDHVRGRKKFQISSMIMNGYSWLTILKEIQKCEVRCANDHIRRHRKGGYRMKNNAVGYKIRPHN
jgi:hypothetical protein